MGLSEPAARLSHEDFLGWEAMQAATKHEFVRGEVFAKVGARRSHASVTLNVGAELRARLMGGPCFATQWSAWTPPTATSTRTWW